MWECIIVWATLHSRVTQHETPESWSFDLLWYDK